jgi:hypothetical protein
MKISRNGLLRFSVRDISELLGKGDQFVREAMKAGIFPFAIASRAPNSQHYTYYVNPKKVKEFVGEVDYNRFLAFKGYWETDEMTAEIVPLRTAGKLAEKSGG